MARTWNSCVPSSTVKNTAGETHGAHSAPLKEHSNVEPGWSATNEKTAVSLFEKNGGFDSERRDRRRHDLERRPRPASGRR